MNDPDLRQKIKIVTPRAASCGANGAGGAIAACAPRCRRRGAGNLYERKAAPGIKLV
ncbi:MAG TPA: hypothetical protein VG819_14040 [Rhizomicrobium sp.]|nr:hypothetical protein [Rhizomicrobium sp.]